MHMTYEYVILYHTHFPLGYYVKITASKAAVYIVISHDV